MFLQGLNILAAHLFLHLSIHTNINTDALEPQLKVTYRKFAVRKEKVDRIYAYCFLVFYSEGEFFMGRLLLCS